MPEYTFASLFVLAIAGAAAARGGLLRRRAAWVTLGIFGLLTIAADLVLTGLPIVTYGDEHRSGIGLGPMPIEDLLYGLALCLAAMTCWHATEPIRLGSSVRRGSHSEPPVAAPLSATPPSVSPSSPPLAPGPPVAAPSQHVLRLLLRASRPFSWANTALPFLAGALVDDPNVTPATVVGAAYFLLPFNLLMYGVNDVFDYESDRSNPRKASLEGALVAPAAARTMWTAVLVLNVPFLAVLWWLGGPLPGAAFLLAAGLAVIYSAPPLRTKVRPVLDSLTSALHFVTPAVCGLLVAGRSLDALPLVPLAGYVAWGMASHALGAIQDIAYDRAAGIGSIATVLGVRATALFSLAGYGCAVAAAASIGTWGPQAAWTIAPYLILPASVLASPTEVQARRAWRSFLGLNLLVGFLLSQIFLRHWGAVPALGWIEVALLSSVGCGLVVFGMLVANAIALRRRPVVLRAPSELPSLAVIVPCRDEAHHLPACLGALNRLAYPNLTVIVVDDGSTDGSGDMARRRGATVITAPPPPVGWVGKSWAAWTGACSPDAAESELILFVDADTEVDPGCARALVDALLAGDHDLMSGVTRYVSRTPVERLLVPGFALLLFGFLPLWLLAMLRGRPAGLAFAYGPLILVRRAAYLAVGGHAVGPDSLIDDVALARTFARAGRSIGLVQASDLAATRHYTRRDEIVAAWDRLFYPYVGYSLPVAIVTVFAFGSAWLLPPVLAATVAVLALAGNAAAAASLPLAVGGLGLMLANRAFLSAWQRQPAADILWTPLTAACTLLLQIRGAAIALWGARPAWHGRRLSPDRDRSAGDRTAAGEDMP